MMKQSLLFLLLGYTSHAQQHQQQGCRTTTSTQSITCTQTSCTPRYDGGCSDDEFQEDSTQTYCNVQGDTTTCGYSVICCSPQSQHGGGGGTMMTTSQSSGTCGNGNRGNTICPIVGECCSPFGWCGTTPDHCSGGGGGDSSNTNNYNNNQATTATEPAASDWWDNEAIYKKDPSSSSTRYTDTYSSTWNGLPSPSDQQNLRSSTDSYNTRSSSSQVATSAGAGAGLGFAFVVIGIAGCYAWRREQEKADCPGGMTDGVVLPPVVNGVLDADGGSLARRYGIDSSSEEEEEEEDVDVRSKRSRNTNNMGRDPSVYGSSGVVVEQVEDVDGRSKSSSSSRRGMGRDPSVRNNGGSIRSSSNGGGGSNRRRSSVEDHDARSHRTSTTRATTTTTKSKRGGGGNRDPSINNGSTNVTGTGSNSSSNGSSTKDKVKKKKKKQSQYPAPASAPPRPPPPPQVMNLLDRKLSNNSKESDSRKQRKEWVKKTIYDTGSEEDEDGFDDDTDSQLNWAA